LVPVVSAAASEATQVAQAHPDAKLAATEAAQWPVFEEIYGSGDRLESFAICLKEAARRADRVRVHGYICDLIRTANGLREPYSRIVTLEKLGGEK
jgi:hypothetical protein